MDNTDENHECLNKDTEVEKALSVKKSYNSWQHFVLTNKRAKSMKLSGNMNTCKKRTVHIELESAAEGIRPLH